MTPAHLLLRRTVPALLFASVVAGSVAAVLVMRQSPGVEVDLAFTVPVPAWEGVPARPERGEVTLPRGDRFPPQEESAFEALQAAALFAETLTGWLQSPDFVAASYDRAHLRFPQPTVRRLSRTFVSRKLSGQVVDVRFRARSAEEAAALASAVEAEVESRTQAFNANTPHLRFRAVSGEPLIIPVHLSPWLRGLVAGLVVFIIGINGVLLWDFFRTTDPSGRGERGTPTDSRSES